MKNRDKIILNGENDIDHIIESNIEKEILIYFESDSVNLKNKLQQYSNVKIVHKNIIPPDWQGYNYIQLNNSIKEKKYKTIIVHGNIKNEQKWKRIATYSLISFALLIISYFIFSYFDLPKFPKIVELVKSNIDQSFFLFLLAGFIAQLIDGLVGMGYGVSSSTMLLSMGVSPAAVSGSVHTAEIFSSAVSGYSHFKFGNVNKKLFKVLVIPGVLGAVIGAVFLVWLGDKFSNYIRPLLAIYCMILGVRILVQAFKKNTKPKKIKRAGVLAWLGGFLDSFGGGGWGPLVTSTLISKGRSPQYVIGSVSLSEFFVTLGSAFSFFILIGITHWQVIVGLMLGGGIAAPIAAKLSGKLPLKSMLICVGIMVILWSSKILLKFI